MNNLIADIDNKFIELVRNRKMMGAYPGYGLGWALQWGTIEDYRHACAHCIGVALLQLEKSGSAGEQE